MQYSPGPQGAYLWGRQTGSRNHTGGELWRTGTAGLWECAADWLRGRQLRVWMRDFASVSSRRSRQERGRCFLAERAVFKTLVLRGWPWSFQGSKCHWGRSARLKRSGTRGERRLVRPSRPNLARSCIFSRGFGCLYHKSHGKSLNCMRSNF